MQLSILETILSLLIVSIFVSSLFRQLKFPVIVGYLMVGVVVGPFMLKLVADTQDIRDLAEFGVVFLMFTIGLEFSLRRMWAMKKTVFLYGGLQVFLTTLVTAVVGLQFKMTLAEVLIVGGIVALSSTAIVLKQLRDQGELYLKHGLNSVGILLFQDLAVIPLLILIPSLKNIAVMGLVSEFYWAAIKGVFALIVILSFGRWVLRPLFYYITKTRSLELFTLMTLLVTLGSAWLTHELGLSLALGAFLAGMMLGETEFKHQIEADIRPFRDVLLGFFFITVGMQLNIPIVVDAWQWVILMLLALILFKTVLIMGIAFIFDRNKESAFRTGIVLAQGGEFGFAILSLALGYQLLPEDYAQVILCALLFSMALAPILITLNERLTRKIFGASASLQHPVSDELVIQQANELKDHVVICGYGRVGQTIARFLEKAEIPYLALDLDSERVKQAVSAGEPVCYADGTQPEILERANIKQAKALIVSFYGIAATNKIIERIRKYHKNIPIIVRSHNENEVHELYQQGATEVVTDTLESSLMLTAHVLFLLKVNPKQVFKWMGEVQHHRYDLIRMIYPKVESMGLKDEPPMHEALHAIKLSEPCYAIGQRIDSFDIFQSDLKVTALRRGPQRIVNPDHALVLEKDDVIVIFGPLPLIERAENILLKGK